STSSSAIPRARAFSRLGSRSMAVTCNSGSARRNARATEPPMRPNPRMLNRVMRQPHPRSSREFRGDAGGEGRDRSNAGFRVDAHGANARCRDSVSRRLRHRATCAQNARRSRCSGALVAVAALARARYRERSGAAMQSAPLPAPDALIGTVVSGRYRVIRLLGEGGMGQVYLAEHVAIERSIALKVLRAEYSRKSEMVSRFQQEAKSASRIEHPNVLDVFDFGQLEDGRFFLAMEYLEGHDLADEMAQQRL